jgi:hypothetical protein
MDPISQTILTLVLMLATFFWGKMKGFNHGAIWAFDKVLDEIEADSYSIDTDNDCLRFFKRGAEFSAKKAWSDEKDNQ